MASHFSERRISSYIPEPMHVSYLPRVSILPHWYDFGITLEKGTGGRKVTTWYLAKGWPHTRRPTTFYEDDLGVVTVVYYQALDHRRDAAVGA